MSDTEQSAEELREEIARTRADLAHTVDALTDKLDVKAQAKHKTQALTDSAKDAATKVSAAAPQPAQDAVHKLVHGVNVASTNVAPVLAKASPYRRQIVAAAAVVLALVTARRRWTR